MNEITPTETEGQLLYTGRLVPAGREGNKVFARSLRPEEEDTGEVVNVGPGEQLIIRPGDLVIDSSDIDAQSRPGLGGYAPVANTVWTWFSIVNAQVGFFLYLFAVARRLDAAHALWELAIQQREKAKTEPALIRRQGFFMSLSEAEVAIIALHRALNMLLRFNSVFPTGLEVPDHLLKLERVIRDMRHAFEHIDERAQGKVNRAGQMDAEALIIFDQPDFIDTSMLHFRGEDLDFYDDVLAALLACRELVMQIMELRANAQSA